VQKLCIHAHFYEPRREDPRTGHIGAEPVAAPFRNWNERITEEVYMPNAKLGNFQGLSFNINADLLTWLAEHTATTYDQILSSVNTHHERSGVNNVVAMPYHNIPLTQLSARDRLTELRWGRAQARRTFGYIPQGVMLPEFAVDVDTLQAVVDSGFRYTVLKPSQLDGLPTHRPGSGPYRLTLPSGDRLFIFTVQETLSKSFVHEMVERGGAGYWARRELTSYCRHAGEFTLLYVDGELLGQHNMAEAYFIHYLLNSEINAAAFKPVTLEAYFESVDMHIAEVELLAPQVPNLSNEQTALFGALDALQADANHIFEETVGEPAWLLRDDYFSKNPALPMYRDLLDSQWALLAAREGIHTLHRDPMRPSVILQHVAHALQLINYATGTDLSERFTALCEDDVVDALTAYQNEYTANNSASAQAS